MREHYNCSVTKPQLDIGNSVEAPCFLSLLLMSVLKIRNATLASGLWKKSMCRGRIFREATFTLLAGDEEMISMITDTLRAAPELFNL